jgi:hypothetical protein
VYGMPAISLGTGYRELIGVDSSESPPTHMLNGTILIVPPHYYPFVVAFILFNDIGDKLVGLGVSVPQGS